MLMHVLGVLLHSCLRSIARYYVVCIFPTGFSPYVIVIIVLLCLTVIGIPVALMISVWFFKKPGKCYMCTQMGSAGKISPRRGHYSHLTWRPELAFTQFLLEVLHSSMACLGIFHLGRIWSQYTCHFY